MAYALDEQVPVHFYPESVLNQFAIAVLRGLGATAQEAQIIADGLITAALWWHPGQGQGLEKLLRYQRRVNNGGIVPGAEMRWIKEGPAFASLDAAQGFGYVAAHRAMQRAVELAKEAGVGLVSVRDSNHFGIAGCRQTRIDRLGLYQCQSRNGAVGIGPTGPGHQPMGHRDSTSRRVSNYARHRADHVRQGHDALVSTRGPTYSPRLGFDA